MKLALYIMLAGLITAAALAAYAISLTEPKALEIAVFTAVISPVPVIAYGISYLFLSIIRSIAQFFRSIAETSRERAELARLRKEDALEQRATRKAVRQEQERAIKEQIRAQYSRGINPLIAEVTLRKWRLAVAALALVAFMLLPQIRLLMLNVTGFDLARYGLFSQGYGLTRPFRILFTCSMFALILNAVSQYQNKGTWARTFSAGSVISLLVLFAFKSYTNVPFTSGPSAFMNEQVSLAWGYHTVVFFALVGAVLSFQARDFDIDFSDLAEHGSSGKNRQVAVPAEAAQNTAVPATPLQTAKHAANEFSVYYRGGHPEYPSGTTGYIQINSEGLHFSSDATDDEFSLHYSHVLNIGEPRNGDLPPQLIERRQNMAKRVNVGASITSFARGAITSQFGAASGSKFAVPQNRVVVLFRYQGTQVRANFDFDGETSESCSQNASRFWSSTARMRQLFSKPATSQVKPVRGTDEEPVVIVACPKCEAKLRTKTPGLIQCPGCRTKLRVSPEMFKNQKIGKGA